MTNLPDDHANLNAGLLADGRRFLLSNAMPNIFRDPLFLSTTTDGWHWNATTAFTSCELPIFTAPDQPWGCIYRYAGGAKQSGCQYPQGLSLTDPAPPAVQGLWAIFALNKEDIWIISAPISSFA